MEESVPDSFEPDNSESLNQIGDLEDGSKIFEIIKANEEPESYNYDFYRNLAEDLPDSTLAGLAEEILDEIDSDKQSRLQWDKTTETGLKYLGFTVEEFRTVPFATACAAYDTTLSTSLYSAWGVIRAELLPSSGPANSIVLGEETEILNQKAAKLKKLLNDYLTVVDKSYYPDCDVHFLYTAFMGNGFKKVWQDPIARRPMSRTIAPGDIYIDNNCTDVLSSSRITHRIELSRQDILLKQMAGEFLNVSLRQINDDANFDNPVSSTINRIDGVSYSQSDNKNLFDYYECHTIRYIKGVTDTPKMKDEEFPCPYIVTIDVLNRKIVKIIRNWKEDDETYKRKECFVHSKYLPGFGLYGYGLLQMLGSNSVALTAILRQAIDSGSFANFPAFIKLKGLKMENNDKLIGPGEAHDIESGGAVRIQDAIMPLPYKGADATLMALRLQLKDECKQPAGVAETQISDKHTEAAMGTILALLEKATIVQSSVMRCLHHTFSQELQLIYECFRNHMTDEPYTFKLKGETVTISKQDFDDSVRIVPVSDADIDTNTQRTLKAYGQLQIAERFPQYHDMREVLRRVYSALNVQEIDKILLPVKEAIPLDPISENMNCMQNKPLKVGMYQNHKAHILSHSTSPCAEKPDMQDHIQTHFAYDYLIEMQQTMGIQLPPLEQIADNEELEKQISQLAAEASQKLSAQKQSQQDPTPQQVLMLDIEQRDRAAKLKNEEARMKVESESAKAGLQFEAEMAKLQAQLEMAEEKNEKDLEIADMKHDEAMEKAKETKKLKERE